MVTRTPKTDRDRPSEAGAGAQAGWLERHESALMLFGPLLIGITAACYGAASRELTATGALAAGWGLWQLSMIVVMFWNVAWAQDDPEDVERMRLGYKPRRRR